jgi:hypothetical protein
MPPVREVRVGSARTMIVTTSPAAGAFVSRTEYESAKTAGSGQKKHCNDWNSTTFVDPSDSSTRTPSKSSSATSATARKRP